MSISQQTNNQDNQPKTNASGGKLNQKQIGKRIEEIDTLDIQVMHWHELREKEANSPEGLSDSDYKALARYRGLYSEYQFLIESQASLEQGVK